jgi:hypothetical protein
MRLFLIFSQSTAYVFVLFNRIIYIHVYVHIRAADGHLVSFRSSVAGQRLLRGVLHEVPSLGDQFSTANLAHLAHTEISG